MTHNLVETETFTATVQVPDDGDLCNDTSVEVGFQALANRTRYLKKVIPNGTLLGGKLVTPLFHTSGISTGLPKGVTVSQIHALLIGDDLISTSSDTDVTYAEAEAPGWTGAGAGLGYWYLYAYNQSGVVGFLWSKTAPDPTRVWRAGAETHRYMGVAVYSGASQVCAGVTKAAGKVRLITPGPFRVGANHETPYHDTGLVGLIPPHIRRAHVNALVDNGNAFAAIGLNVYGPQYNPASPALGDKRLVLVAPANTRASADVVIELDASQGFVWLTEFDGSGGQPTDLALIGWEEDEG